MCPVHALFDVAGRVALVTGSSRGIGRALAGGLAGAGATVVLNGRDPDAVAAAREALAQETGAVRGMKDRARGRSAGGERPSATRWATRRE